MTATWSATGSGLFVPPAFVAPAFLSVPEGRRGTLGPEVVDFTTSIGHPVDAEQAADIDAFASLGGDGNYLASEVCKVEGRQNGKTDRTLLPLTLYDFFVLGAMFVDWTAHLMKTARKTKVVVERLIRANPELLARLDRVVDARDAEAIILKSGAVWQFSARAGGAGRGEQADVWVADEALYLTPAMIGARRPTMRSRPNAQMRLASSAALKQSTVLRGIVKRGRAYADPGGRPDPSLIYSEHCAPGGFDDPGCALPGCTHTFGVEGCTLDREDLWHLANHAMGRRISYATMRSERRGMDPTEFARELLGWHEAGPDDEETIPLAKWDALVDRSSKVRKGDRPVFVVAVRPSQESAVVAVAGARHDGRTHLGLIREAVKMADLPDEMARLVRKHQPRLVVLGPGAGSKHVGPALDAVGVRHRRVSDVDLGSAFAALLASVKADDCRHRGDLNVRLSLERSTPKVLTDGTVSIDRTADGDDAPIVAMALARWGVAIGPRVLTDDELRDSLG